MSKKITLALLMLMAFFQAQVLFAKTPPFTFSAKHAVFSKDKSQLIYLSSKGYPQKAEILKISARNGKLIKHARIKKIRELTPFAATPDGFKFLANTAKGIAVIHNGTGKVLRTLPYPRPINKDGISYLQSHDGVLLAIPSSDRINIIHTGSGKNLYTIKLVKHDLKQKHYPIITSMGFGAKRRYFAYITESPSLKKTFLTLYDVYTKNTVAKINLSNSYYSSGNIHFSKNGQTLIAGFYNRQGFSLINIKSQTVKNIKSSNFSFMSFTSDNTKIILVHPNNNQISLYSIKSGKYQRNYIKLWQKDGYYGFDEVLSYDKSLIALPFHTRNPDKEGQFLILNSQTGKVLRQIHQ